MTTMRGAIRCWKCHVWFSGIVALQRHILFHPNCRRTQ